MKTLALLYLAASRLAFAQTLAPGEVDAWEISYTLHTEPAESSQGQDGVMRATPAFSWLEAKGANAAGAKFSISMYQVDGVLLPCDVHAVDASGWHTPIAHDARCD